MNQVFFSFELNQPSLDPDDPKNLYAILSTQNLLFLVLSSDRKITHKYIYRVASYNESIKWFC